MPYLTLLAFLGNDALTGFSTWARTLLLSLLIVLGWINAFQGLVSTYRGAYMDPAFSPLMATWQDLTDPRRYDIYWIRNSYSAQGWKLLVMPIGLVLLGVTLRSWIDFFHRSDMGGAE